MASAALASSQLSASLHANFPGIDSRVLRDVLASFFWRWYSDNADTVLVKRKVLFFSLTVRVRDLRGLFVLLFGEEPASNPAV